MTNSEKIRSYAFSGAVVYLIFCLLGRVVRFNDSSGIVIASDNLLAASLSTLVAAALLSYSLLKKEDLSKLVNSLIFLLGLTLLFFTDFVGRSFMFLDPSGVRAPLLAFGTVGILVFTSWRNLDSGSRVLRIVSLPTLLLVQLSAAVFFLRYTDGRLLFSDDHPSFLYRFQLLLDSFPSIPFYNTDWNAGYSAREFFPSGIMNVFFFFWPFLYFGPDVRSFSGVELYNWVIPVVFFFVVPLSIYWASRRWGLGSVGATVAALCALGPSFSFFEWLLRYGTLGFACSMGLVPLALVLATEVGLEEKKARWSSVGFLLIAASCCIAWTLTAFVFIPAVLLALYYLKRDWKAEGRSRLAKILVFTLLFAALNGPWLTVFVRESKVFSFVSGHTMPGSQTRSVHDAGAGKNAEVEKTFSGELAVHYSSLQQAVGKLNPVLVLLFLPGLLLIADKRRRFVLFSTIVWLVMLALIGDYLKPQLELRRMMIPAAFLMCIPVGRIVEAYFARAETWIASERKQLNLSGYILCSLIFAVVAISPANAISHYLNRAHLHYRFAPNSFEHMTEAIKEFGGEGRVLFTGFILHDFGSENYATQDGGHVAPLAYMSGKELYASDFYHSRWSTVDPIPESYRKRGAEGIEEFLDLINVTSVITFKREWVDYFSKDSKYVEKYQDGRFRLFTRKIDSKITMIARGDAETSRERDGFSVVPKSREVVLRYRYHPRLKVYPAGAAEVFSEPAFVEEVGGGRREQVSFIGLRFPEELQAVHVGFSPGS